MLQNAYFLAKIGADTAENEQHFAEILPKTGNYRSNEEQGGTGRIRRERNAAFLRDVRRVVLRKGHLFPRLTT